MSKGRIVHFITLFTSTSTLFCCALPALLAVVAGGAAVSSLISIFPWLIPLSEHKDWLFVIAGFSMTLSGITIFKPKAKLVCLATGGKGCEVAGKFTRFMFFTSLAIFLTGVFFAYALVPLLQLFEA